MNVIQLIDSLEAGGAERVAVNYANALVTHIDHSFLCVTRAEGILKQTVEKEVGYFFLEKRSTLDVKAIIKLHKYVNRHHITVVHAHASSYFLATLIKCLNPSIKLVWHDHYGKSEFLDQRSKFVLRLCSFSFNQVLCVNSKLVAWCKKYLKIKNVNYFPNFATINTTKLRTQLKSTKGKRIVCLANLREQKDHINLLSAFIKIQEKYPDWTLHLVGKDFNDTYSKSIHNFVKRNKLQNSVFIHGSCSDTSAILNVCDIGVLSSRSEGLPLALLEYGLTGLPVVVTEVGYCGIVVKHKVNGLVVKAESSEDLANAIERLIENETLRIKMGEHLHKEVKKEYSKDAVLRTLLNKYKAL